MSGIVCMWFDVLGSCQQSMLSGSGFSVRLCVTCRQIPQGRGTTHEIPFEVIVLLLSLYKVIAEGLYIGNKARK